MRIWIDADACPREVKDVIFRAAERTGVAVSLVANTSMFTPRSPLITMVQVKGGHLKTGDIDAIRGKFNRA